MKNQLTLFSLFFVVITYGQESKKRITGKIFFDNTTISDVHIVNKNSNQGTITDNNGWFEIPVSIGDSLQITHINLQEKQIVIKKKQLLKNNLRIELQEKTYTLDEITLGKPRSLFYVDPEMMPPPIVNAQTLNLPYATTTVKKEYSVLKIRSGGVINIDNLIGALNGNNKRRKELQKIIQEDNVLSKIRKHFTDDFFITDLKIKKENINPFLNFCFKKNIIHYYKAQENIKLIKILIDESHTFHQKIKIENAIAVNKLKK